MLKNITIILALVLATVGLAWAADKADEATVTGTVAIAKADDGAVTVAITVPAAKDAKDAKAVVYAVVQDEIGKTLVKMADKTVTAVGTVAEVKGVLTLTVKEVKVQEAKKEAPAAAK